MDAMWIDISPVGGYLRVLAGLAEEEELGRLSRSSAHCQCKDQGEEDRLPVKAPPVEDYWLPVKAPPDTDTNQQS